MAKEDLPTKYPINILEINCNRLNKWLAFNPLKDHSFEELHYYLFEVFQVIFNVFIVIQRQECYAIHIAAPTIYYKY